MNDYVIIQPNPNAQPTTIVAHKTVRLHEDGNNQSKLLYDIIQDYRTFALALIAK